VNLDFLIPAAEADGSGEIPVARSPMEEKARTAGARFEVRDGWNVAVAYGAEAAHEAAAASATAGWADVSHLAKLEVQAPADALAAIAADCQATLTLGEAVRAADAWWCRLTPTRALVICEPGAAAGLRERLAQAAAGAEGAHVLDVSTVFAALTLVGPLAREVLARFCALDLRPSRTPVRALRPGSIGRQPGILICEGEDRYLFLFGWATGEYMWSIVADAGVHLGGAPIGLDALARLARAESAAPQQESVGA
jgi:heterotetrameric sarcosine oxidase gamma subunit